MLKYIVSGIRLVFLALFIFLLLSGHMILWLAFFAASLVLSFVFGRLYCGYACPMNTLMIPAEWISKKLDLQTKRTPRWLRRGYFAWVALVVSIAAMLLSKRFFHVDLPVLPFWLVIAVLLTLRYHPAVFHNLICPFGALLRITGRFALLSKRVIKDACVGCKICEGVCPVDAIAVQADNRKAIISTALCHQCTSCQDVCKKNAIKYGRKL